MRTEHSHLYKKNALTSKRLRVGKRGRPRRELQRHARAWAAAPAHVHIDTLVSVTFEKNWGVQRQANAADTWKR